MADNLGQVWNKFYKYRVNDLFNRFPGWYRAQVVDTNDPLQIYRIRFKCPELHDIDIKNTDCPWAIPAPSLGGKNAGSWTHPMIGDIIWITWEKNHPYGPIWCGFATGTRRKRYPLESIYTNSPLALKLDGDADETPDDYLEEYLPLDKRPMSTGQRDRYGNYKTYSSIGYYPKEHDLKPTDPGTDAIARRNFEVGAKPQVNVPDRKLIAEVTKYGILTIQSDVGYWWKDDGLLGEFTGDFDEDRDFEIKRSKYLTRLLNEDTPLSDDQDQRRYMVLTRAGHKFEMRDVGWAQIGGAISGCSSIGLTKSRDGEYDKPSVLSRWAGSDERWVKWRTKGGHLVQMMDIGFHPSEDEFYKKKLIDEVGSKGDLEKEHGWDSRDARQIRFVTRHGYKFVLDDRGTSPTDAEGEELPRGNGWLLKTRRSYTDGESTPRGFALEANDKDELNTTRWYSPKSKIVELNDRQDYVMACTDTATEISREWKKLEENEFATKVAATENPEDDTYHLKLDKHNGYIRLKTASGGDNGRRQEPLGLGSSEEGINQGLEARDGRTGSDGAWTEVVDIEDRGLWFSKNEKLGIWRSVDGKDQYIAIRDKDNSVIIRNKENGKIQIYCGQDIEIIADRNLVFKANNRISFKAGSNIDFESAASGHFQISGNGINMDVPVNAPELNGRLPGAAAGSGAQEESGSGNTPIDPELLTQDKRKPEDRGFVENTPEEVDEKVITSCD